MIHLICPNPAVDRTILLENFAKDIPNRPLEVQDFPGGKSFNVAYALGREAHSEEVTIHTILGGQNGQRVRFLAEEAGYSISAVQVDKNTRECNIIVDVASNDIYPIYESGFTLTPELLDEFTQQLINSVHSNDTVVFSGSLMKGMSTDYIANVQQQVNDSTVKFIVDTSGDALVATYEKAQPYAIKINDEEFNELFSDKNYETISEIAEALKTKVNDSIPYFIVTLGKDGALAKYNDEILHFSGLKIDLKNPVASGDHFLGNLVRGLVNQESIEDILKNSIAYASSNCQYWYPHIEKSDVENFVKQVEVVRY